MSHPIKMRRITNADIVEIRSKNGGYSRKQLRLLKVPWPPPKGWVKRLIGKNIPEDVYQQALQLKDKHLP